MKRTILAAISFALLSSAAIAADLRGSTKDAPANVLPNTDVYSNAKVDWNGIYIGVEGGYSDTNHEINVDTKGSPSYNILDLNGLNSSGFVGGFNAGFDRQIGNWVIGVLGGYDFSNEDAKLSVGNGALTGTLDKQNEWYAGARAGRIVGDRTLIYLLAAYDQSDYKVSSGAFSKTETYDGVKVGGGMEYALAPNMFVKLQYDHNFYRDVKWADTECLTVKDTPDEDRFMVGLNIKFNRDLFGR